MTTRSLTAEQYRAFLVTRAHYADRIRSIWGAHMTEGELASIARYETGVETSEDLWFAHDLLNQCGPLPPPVVAP